MRTDGVGATWTSCSVVLLLALNFWRKLWKAVLAVAMQQKSAKCLIAKQTTGAAAGPTQVASGRRHA